MTGKCEREGIVWNPRVPSSVSNDAILGRSDVTYVKGVVCAVAKNTLSTHKVSRLGYREVSWPDVRVLK